jgi:hypothetical protein
MACEKSDDFPFCQIPGVALQEGKIAEVGRITRLTHQPIRNVAWFSLTQAQNHPFSSCRRPRRCWGWFVAPEVFGYDVCLHWAKDFDLSYQ